jgi:eukaryotic-like serine/threonine-protein kinase
MLSLRPEQRGTAAQLAQELERAADSLTLPRSPPSPSVPEQPAARSAEPPAASPASTPRAPMHSRRRWLAITAAAGALATWAGWMALDTSGNPR